MNRIGETIAAATVAGALLAGCGGSPHHPETVPTTSATSTSVEQFGPVLPPADNQELTFNFTPGPSVNETDCHANINGWVNSIDIQPLATSGDVTTVGLIGSYESTGAPILDAGVTYRRLGSFTYQIATSDDPERSLTIDLKKGPFTRLLKAGPDFDGILVIRKGEAADPNVYVSLNCLPDYSILSRSGLPSYTSPGETPPATT